MFDIFFISTNKTHPYLKELRDRFVFAKHAETVADAQKKSLTKMFWVVWDDLVVSPDFNFDYAVPEWDMQYVHSFKNSDNTYFGINLMPREKYISSKEIEYRTFLGKKEVDVVASSYRSYDVFTVNTYEDYQNALEKSVTELFWAVASDIKPVADFKFDLTFGFSDRYDKDENHAFLHEVDDKRLYDGIFLLSKNKPISKREVEHRFLVNKKEWDIVASTNKPYDVFTVDSYEDYLHALESSTTELFWITGTNIKPVADFKFDLTFRFTDDYNKHENHAFLHDICGTRKYDGIFLLSKHKQVSKREIENRFLVTKKEWDIVASTNKPYDLFTVDSYEDYLHALETATTELFWITSSKIKILPEFDLNLYFETRTDEFLYDRGINHAFLHDICGTKKYDGIFLLSKKAPVSKREIENRFLVTKKEWEIVASTNKPYDLFTVDTYSDYVRALETATTELFWIVPSEVKIDPSFNLDLFFEDRTDKLLFDRTTHHSFKHKFRNELNYNGVSLVTRDIQLSEREIKYRFVINSKRHDEVASELKPYDIIFISYNEPNADENFAELSALYPRAKRVHGVKGIHRAHLKAAELSETGMFWVVDGDAKILESFKFDHQVSVWDYDTVHVWKSVNPINDLEYGYGGVKLLPRKETLNMDLTSLDMTTSISKNFKAVSEVSNVTAFNTDPFNTWKSAFRECAKLASRVISGQKTEETLERLELWCSTGADKPLGNYAIAGALAGKEFAETRQNELYLINNFDWLQKEFNKKAP